MSSTHSRATLNKQMYYWMTERKHHKIIPYVWTNYYEAIAASNMALEAIEEAGDTDEYSTAKGEALVVGAF
ncbi:MAG: RagB/SusD family nutrient uptake outer membrane protein [Butyricimonas paravirosa]